MSTNRDVFDDLPRMTEAAVNALMGGTGGTGPKRRRKAAPVTAPLSDDTGFGELNKLVWQIAAALKDADAPAGMGFAGRNVATPFVEPPMPDLDFSFPMPAWADA